MTKGLLGNLAAFNTVLHLSMPNTPSTKDNRTTETHQTEVNGMLSTLVSTSALDRGYGDYSRPAELRTSMAYDPFLARSLERYSPPGTDSTRSAIPDTFGMNRGPSIYDVAPPRPMLQPQLSTISGASDVNYASRESLQRTPVIEQETSTRRQSQDGFIYRNGSPPGQCYEQYDVDGQRPGSDASRGPTRYHTRRRPFNQDEFDGPSQYLPLPLPQQDSARAQNLSELPVHLDIAEQDEVMQRANDILSECAFHFIAKYQFPVPLERDKPRVRTAADREWTEWAYLLKRLATKRRIPARVLYDNQIKQLVTTLENSIAARQSAHKDQMSTRRKPRDDRYILQLISAGTQVARILMDSLAMEQLDDLYNRTEAVVMERRRHSASANSVL